MVGPIINFFAWVIEQVAESLLAYKIKNWILKVFKKKKKFHKK